MPRLPKDSPLDHAFYARDAATVARRLIGCVLERRLDDGRVLSGVISETEAYTGPRMTAPGARLGFSCRRVNDAVRHVG